MNPAFEATRSFAAMPEPGAVVASRFARRLLGVCLGLLLPRQFARMQRMGRADALGHIDRRTGLYNQAGLMACAGEMLSRARAEGRNLSVLVIEFSDLREVHEIYGQGVSRKLIARLVRKLTSLAGANGLVGRTGVAQFTVVLPMRRENALRAIQRVLGKPARIEFDAGDDEIVLVPELVLDCTNSGTDSIDALWRDLCAEVTRLQKSELRRQHYLQRERERHSRPMSLPART